MDQGRDKNSQDLCQAAATEQDPRYCQKRSAVELT
jgi:hypothetical protein